jgi:Ca2+:H+ antiporter
MAGQMALALEVAFGSTLQIATVVGPVLVILGFFLGQPMDLAFSWIELAAIGIPVALTASVSQDGEVNWLEGVALLGCYLVVAVGFFLYPIIS